MRVEHTRMIDRINDRIADSLAYFVPVGFVLSAGLIIYGIVLALWK